MSVSHPEKRACPEFFAAYRRYAGYPREYSDKAHRPPLRPGFHAIACLLLIFGLLTSLAVQAEATPPAAAVASAHPLATDAGIEILAAGGNAFDAAIATGAVLAVVEPYSSGLGGGGFWLLHRARDGFEVMVDGRERAPLAARRDMYLDTDGAVIPGRSVDGALAAGIPGTVAAMVHLAKHYGALPLKRTLRAAIALAAEGFPVDAIYRRLARFRLPALHDSPAAARTFLTQGRVPAMGEQIRQPELAATLRLIADKGHEGFYAGELAERLVSGIRQAGGIWTLEDLRQYRVVERAPVHGEYHGTRIASAAPPSSGGVILVEMLNVLSGYPLASMHEAQRMHLIVEAMRRAYRDRAQYLGDPDFVSMPLERLISAHYAAGLRAGITPYRATPSEHLPGFAAYRPEGRDTTHFSIIDKQGNRVAATLSINYPFGSGFMPPGTGVLLNDEMDDFAAKPGSPNVYGLVGAQANAIAPGKRMLSSMSPSFLDDGRRVAILGTPGGSRIITMLLLATLEFARGESAQAIVNLPRYHHQYLPDVIEFEPQAINADLLTDLRALGHRLRPLESPYGNMHAIVWERQSRKISAASDSRGIGKAVVFQSEPVAKN